MKASLIQTINAGRKVSGLEALKRMPRRNGESFFNCRLARALGVMALDGFRQCSDGPSEAWICVEDAKIRKRLARVWKTEEFRSVVKCPDVISKAYFVWMDAKPVKKIKSRSAMGRLGRRVMK